MGLVGAVAALQLGAAALQVAGGFVPFARAPTRVPYSWDMFAIRIDRCVVSWDPPLRVDGEAVAHWHDRMPAIEFDGVFNDAAYYEAEAEFACGYRSAPRTVATVACFTGDGNADERRSTCP